MNKWVTFGLVALASMSIAGASLADVPSALTSTTACSCTADAGGGASAGGPLTCTITPAGTAPSEEINVDIVVRNVLGAPLAGSTVTVSAANINGSTSEWCPGEASQVAVSDGGGNANFVFEFGSTIPVASAYPSQDFAVTAVGPGPGGPVTLNSCPTPLDVTSFDVDQDGAVTVTVVDFAVFASDYNTNDLRSDFDHASAAGDPVTVVDFALFAAHFGDACP